MDAILSFVDEPGVQYLLTLLGGWLMVRIPGFQRRAIPMLTLILNLMISILGAMFGVKPAEAAGGPGAAAAQLGPLLDALLTWTAATGTHSGLKNTLQWVRNGGGFLRRVR